jgi:hypothetical protein
LISDSACAKAGVNQAGVNIELDVDLSDAGAKWADDVLRTNVVAYIHEYISQPIWNKFFDERRVGDVLFDTMNISREAADFNDLKRRMCELGPLVKKVIAAGGRVQPVFQNGIPKWLSSDPHNNGDLFEVVSSEGQKIWQSVPPGEYKVWEDVAYEFVRYFNVEFNTWGRSKPIRKRRSVVPIRSVSIRKPLPNTNPGNRMAGLPSRASKQGYFL